MSLFVAGAPFGDVAVSLFVAGAIFFYVGWSLFVAGVVFRDVALSFLRPIVCSAQCTGHFSVMAIKHEYRRSNVFCIL